VSESFLILADVFIILAAWDMSRAGQLICYYYTVGYLRGTTLQIV